MYKTLYYLFLASFMVWPCLGHTSSPLIKALSCDLEVSKIFQNLLSSENIDERRKIFRDLMGILGVKDQLFLRESFLKGLEYSSQNEDVQSPSSSYDLFKTKLQAHYFEAYDLQGKAYVLDFIKKVLGYLDYYIRNFGPHFIQDQKSQQGEKDLNYLALTAFFRENFDNKKTDIETLSQKYQVAELRSKLKSLHLVIDFFSYAINFELDSSFIQDLELTLKKADKSIGRLKDFLTLYDKKKKKRKKKVFSEGQANERVFLYFNLLLDLKTVLFKTLTLLERGPVNTLGSSSLSSLSAWNYMQARTPKEKLPLGYNIVLSYQSIILDVLADLSHFRQIMKLNEKVSLIHKMRRRIRLLRFLSLSIFPEIFWPDKEFLEFLFRVEKKIENLILKDFKRNFLKGSEAKDKDVLNAKEDVKKSIEKLEDSLDLGELEFKMAKMLKVIEGILDKGNKAS